MNEQQMTALRHVALSVHADGFDGRAAELSQERVIAVVERLLADAWLEGATHGHDPHLIASTDFDAANPYRERRTRDVGGES